jgi:hypothetical protein
MLNTLFGIFLALHGLVHLLYLGQSARRFELVPGLAWPDGSWAFARLLGEAGVRNLASAALVAAAAAFVAGGAGVIAGQTWGRTAAVIGAVLSTAVFVLCWDGGLQRLHDKGAIGVLLNLGILAVLIFIRRP